MRYLWIVFIVLVALTACGGTTYYRQPEANEDSLRVWFDQASAAYQQNDAPRAVDLFQRVGDADAAFPGVCYNLGLAWSLAGDDAQAEAAFRQHIERQPGDDAPWRALGLMAMQRREPEEALGLFKKALALAPDQPRNLLGAGRASYLTGDMISAIGYLEHGRAADPADADIACSLGLLYMESGREIEGRELLQEAAKLGSAEALDFLAQ